MQLKHLNTVLQSQDGPSKILAIAWAPNNLKLAVCNNDRIIFLFNDKGERKDKFPTKAADPKNGRKSYTVKGLAFSPDSTKLAVGQSDNIIYVYKLGEDWTDKKVICNKFIQQSPVMSLLWLTEGPIIYGQLDGKVKAAHVKVNKLQTLYSSTSCVVSLAANIRGTGFLSGHADGSIVRYYVSEDSNMETQGRILVHRVAPYVLAWPVGGWVLAGGCDRSVCVFDGNDGHLEKTFDYASPNSKEKDFSVACCSPSGQAVAVGGFNRIHLFVWVPSKGSWEEEQIKEIPNLLSVTALAWKRDGSRVVCGAFCGAVDIFESVLKKTIWKNKFEMTYVGLSQVLVKPLNNDSRGVILKSQYGYEIDDVKIMGGDRYLIARTTDTLLLGDLEKNLLSEVRWPDSERNERFYFDYPNVCLVFNAGELSLIEYGNNEILSSVRTEFINPKLVSVRLNERKQLNSNDSNKKLAYLLDLKTICIVDLVYSITILQFSHDSKIDWLELNETGHKLLIRDKKMRLILLDTRSGEKHTILHYSSFVQWVPGSDVVVAQSRGNACVWYNIDTADRISMFPVKGEIVDVIRDSGKIEIVSQDGNQQRNYELDEGLVEFGTAVHDSDFGRAILFLEEFTQNSWNAKRLEAEGMWQNLAEIALQLHNLRVAQRCYAALGDIARTHFLRVTLEIADDYAKKNGGDGMDHLEVWARMAILNKQFKTAETIYVEQNQLDKAIEMYQRLHKWDNAVALAMSKGSHELATRLKSSYMQWLMETRQEGKAAELKEHEGDTKTALNLYLKAGLSLKALRVVQNDPQLSDNEEVSNRIALSLLKQKHYQQAGLFYETLHKNDKALECYRKGQVFNKAVELARIISPKEVIILEEQWGDNLVSNRQFDAAINHYIEAGKTLKALDAAVQDKQWKKAVQIIHVIDDKNTVLKHYSLLANHFASVKDYRQAEELFIEAKMYKQVIDMYIEVGNWEKAYKLAYRYLEHSEAAKLLSKEGKRLEEMGHLKEAEKLYLILAEPDLAISMYKNHGEYDKMLQLVSEYHPELVSTTQTHLAQECAEQGNFAAAERYFTAAKEWKLAVKMYRLANLWEDGYRVAKTMGGDEAGEQVAFLWAKSLGGESAVKLLNKLNILDACIDHACDSYQFEFAFDIATIGAKGKLADIHNKFAMALEDDGKFQQAEEEFIKAGKPKEAVLMYVHNQDWENAERVAEKYDENAMEEVLLAQAKQEFENKNFSNFQALLLRARKPELIVKQYQESGMWTEALQVCSEYLPNLLPSLQSEYDRQVGATVSRDINSLFLQAKQWEQNGEFKTAIDCYVRIASSTKDKPVAEKALIEASKLAIKYLRDEESLQTAQFLGEQLIEAKLYLNAAQVFLSADLFKDAIDAFILAEDWPKAKKLAYEYQPSYESYVDIKYKEYLKKDNKLDQVSDLDILAAQGQWVKCIEKAKLAGEETLQKYLALYASTLLKEGSPLEALELYCKYGAPVYPQNFNIYQRIAIEIISKPGLSESDAYSYWAKLRNMLYQLVESLGESSEISSSFERMFKISHYYAVRTACKDNPSLQPIVAKISIALLRYSDIIPLDKAYYEAGINAKVVGRETEAIVFLNHFLDICEAIEEQNAQLVDFSDLSCTDFPSEVPLPATAHVSPHDQEQVREWILSVLVDQNIDQMLPVDDRNLYPCSLINRNSLNESKYPACIVTGWPVFRGTKLHQSIGGRSSDIEFRKPNHFANKDDWNKIMTATKSTVNKSNLNDVIIFITEWCGDPPGFFFH